MSDSAVGEARMLINGELVDAESGATYDNISPTFETVLGQTADATPADVDRAIEAARAAFDTTDWSTDHAVRLQHLRRFADGIQAAADTVFRPQIIAEGGQPHMVTLGPGLDEPLAHLDWVLETMENFEWHRDLPNVLAQGIDSKRQVWREATGVVAAITPWNFPVQTNLAKIFPALAAGNTVVLKPAPDTPWAATALGKIAVEAQLPPGVFNVVTASDPAEIGEVLCSDPRVDMVTFTGSTAVGKRIMSVASDTVKKVFLELGGKSALILLEDANLDIAALHSLAVCFHAGQGCAIPTRMLVHRSRYQEAVEMLTPIFQGMTYGDPSDPQYMMGPVINRNQYHKILGMIELGVEEGATLVAGGKAATEPATGYFIEPTLFTDVDNSMSIAQHEIFGPVLVMIPFEDDNDAVKIANDSIYGLSGAIHSADKERALAMARRIRTGTLSINGAGFFGPDAPFGGYKQSGNGREMGLEGLMEYMEVKTVGCPA
ncbi:MAG: aldehyde dehydrogenase (NAD+) [Halioglobus sp.]|jgi:aldehyde dehydrogenase (NAD+)